MNRLRMLLILTTITTSVPHSLSAEEPKIDMDTTTQVPIKSGLIKASEIIRDDNSNGRKVILSVNLPEFLVLEYSEDRKNLILKRLREHAAAEILQEIAVPTIKDKVIFEADIFRDGFVAFKFGIPCGDWLGDSDETDDEQSASYREVEHSIWEVANTNEDASKPSLFKIEDPDFKSTWISSDSDFTDPANILVHESSCNLEGEFKFGSQYRFYDLTTRSFTHMLSPLSKNSLHPHYDTNIDGMYNFWCVSEYIGNENKIHKAARDSAGLLVAGDLIYTTTAKHITWHLDEQKLVTSERDGDYFQPSIIDLKAKKPRKKIVLTDDEFDQLRSNVYDVCFMT